MDNVLKRIIAALLIMCLTSSPLTGIFAQIEPEYPDITENQALEDIYDIEEKEPDFELAPETELDPELGLGSEPYPESEQEPEPDPDPDPEPEPELEPEPEPETAIAFDFTYMGDEILAGTFTELQAALQNAPDGGVILATENITVTSTLTVSGKSLTITSGEGGPYILLRDPGFEGDMITISENSGLTLTNIILDGNDDNVEANGSLICVKNKSSMLMKDGAVLRNNFNNWYGGGVRNSGTFTMEGGEISGNTANNGGGVYNYNIFLMEGGEISGNTAEFYDGGGVYNNHAFTLKGGRISGNTAGIYGGGVCNMHTFTMKGGEISGNKVEYNGGGVYNRETFTMEGGEISGNTAGEGGGVYNSETFTMEGGEISGNTSEYDGGGVYNRETFTMEGGKIFANTAKEDGGGVYNSYGFYEVFTLTGGEISGNTAQYNGAGVYNHVYYDHFIMNLSGAPILHGLYIKNEKEAPFIVGALGSGADIRLEGVQYYRNSPVIVAKADGQSYTRLTDSDIAAFGTISGGYNFVLNGDNTQILATKSGIPSPASLTVSPDDIAILLYSTTQLHASILPIKADQSVTWRSGNPTVATVDQNGLVTGLKPGVAVIAAESRANRFVRGTATVQVVDYSDVEPVITLQPRSATAFAGEKATFEISASVGIGTLTYQWWENTSGYVWEEIPGATSSRYTTPVLKKSDNETLYMCVVRNALDLKGALCTTRSDEVTLNVTLPITDVELDKTRLELKTGDTYTLTATCLPPDAEQDASIKWASNNLNVATVDASGNVVAIGPGVAAVSAMSMENPKVFAICWVTVTEDVTYALEIKKDDAAVTGQTLIYSPGDPAITLTADIPVTWKSGNTKVATVSSGGVVTFTGCGITTITAAGTGKDKGKSAQVVVAVRDLNPKLLTSALTLSNKSDGAEIQILPGNGFELANVTSETDGFQIAPVPGTSVSYSLSTDKPKGKYKVALKISQPDGIEDKASNIELTVTVIDTVPKATVKMPTLNTFYSRTEGQILLTGKDLPPVARFELADSVKPSDGYVTSNFEVTKDGVISAKSPFVSFTDTKRTKPAVKGILKIYYEGYGDNYQGISVTIPVKDAAPKLTLKPATQTINPNEGYDAVFEVIGGEVWYVQEIGGSGIIDYVTTYGNTFTAKIKYAFIINNPFVIAVWLKGAQRAIIMQANIKLATATTTYKLSASMVTLNSTLIGQIQTVEIIPNQSNVPVAAVVDPIGDVKGITVVSNGAKLTVEVPEGTPAGKYKFNITPNGIAKPLVLTVNVDGKPLTATVKAEKGNISLLDRTGTRLVYVPSIKGTTSEITSVRLVKDGIEYDKFSVVLENGKAVVTAKTDEIYQKGIAYKMRMEFTLAGGSKVCTKDITVKPAQEKVSHNLPKSVIMFQSRMGLANAQVIDLTPQSPSGARVEKVTLKTGNGFWCYFAPDSQKLYIWIADGVQAKPGKSTLAFDVTYVGQGNEKNGQIKPVSLKLNVNVER